MIEPASGFRLIVQTTNFETGAHTDRPNIRAAFPKFFPNERMASHVEHMKSHMEEDLASKKFPHLQFSQEHRSYTNKYGENIDTKTPYFDALKQYYSGVQLDYNKSGPMAFSLYTAFSENIFKLITSESLNVTPHFNETDPKCRHALITKFRRIEEDRTVFAINCHLPLNEADRVTAVDIIGAFAKQKRDENPGCIFVWGGDFNDFIDAGAEKLRAQIASYGWKEATAKIVDDENRIASSTVALFPYDIVNPEPLNIDVLLGEIDNHADKIIVQNAYNTLVNQGKFSANAFIDALPVENPELIRNVQMHFYVRSQVIGGKIDHIYYLCDNTFDVSTTAKEYAYSDRKGDSPYYSDRAEVIKRVMEKPEVPLTTSDHRSIRAEIRFNKIV